MEKLLNWKIEYRIANAQQIAGIEPMPQTTFTWDEPIAADSANYAIELLLQHMIEQLPSDCTAEIDNQTLTVYDDDGAEVERICDITATEVE